MTYIYVRSRRSVLEFVCRKENSANSDYVGAPELALRIARTYAVQVP